MILKQIIPSTKQNNNKNISKLNLKNKQLNYNMLCNMQNYLKMRDLPKTNFSPIFLVSEHGETHAASK